MRKSRATVGLMLVLAMEVSLGGCINPGVKRAGKAVKSAVKTETSSTP